PPRAALSGTLGGGGVTAKQRGAAARRRQDPHRDLALSPQGRARADLPPLARLLQPREFALDADQRRRPGELLEMPPGALLRRRRLGELRAPHGPRPRE